MLLQFLRYFTLLTFLLSADVLHSKEFNVHLNVQPAQTKIALFGIYGSELRFIDSIRSGNGMVTLKLNDQNYYEGFYRLQFNDSLVYDFVTGCGNQIKIEVDYAKFEKTFRIKEHNDNETLLSFKKEWDQLIQLHQALLQVPVDDVNEEMRRNIEISIANYHAYKNDLIETYTGKFECEVFKKLIRMNNSEYTQNIRDYLTVFLPMEDSLVIHTVSFNQSIVDFYGKFGEFSQESFEKMTDTLLVYASRNKQNYDFTLNYLYKLFSDVGPQSVFYYLIKKYYRPEHELSIAIRQKIEKFLKYQPGTEIQLENLQSQKGGSFPSKKRMKKNPYHLIIWWDPECEHCLSILPEIQKMEWKTKPPKIYTIAMTDDAVKWNSTLEKLHIGDFENYMDKANWDSSNTKNLLIYKTPFFILLDKNKKIIAYDVDYPEILTFIE